MRLFYLISIKITIKSIQFIFLFRMRKEKLVAVGVGGRGAFPLENFFSLQSFPNRRLQRRKKAQKKGARKKVLSCYFSPELAQRKRPLAALFIPPFLSFPQSLDAVFENRPHPFSLSISIKDRPQSSDREGE